MKKLISLLLITILSLFVFVGCSSSSTNTTDSTSSTTETTAKKDTYENTFDDVVAYMAAEGHLITDNSTEMKAEIIGATKGKSFSSYNTTVEIYEFDLENLSDEANRILDQVESGGYFTIYDDKLQLEGHLTSDKKFLLAYVATSDSDTDVSLEEAGKYFEQFYPEAE